MPQQLSQIAILCVRYPDSRKSGLRSAVAATTAHPVDPFSASVPVCYGSRLRPRSTTQTATRSADAQTSVRARWLPSPLAPSVPGARDRTAQLLPGDSAAVRRTPRFLCPKTQFAGSPDDSLPTIISMFGSFPPSPLVGLRLQSLLGPGSRHCYGIISLIDPIAVAIGARRKASLQMPQLA